MQVRQGSGTMVTPPSDWDMLDELVLAATIAEGDSLAILDDLVVTRRVLESEMANVAARLADAETVDRLRALVDRMDELVDDHVTYHEHDRAFHDTVMQSSGNRIARGVVQAPVHPYHRGLAGPAPRFGQAGPPVALTPVVGSRARTQDLRHVDPGGNGARPRDAGAGAAA
ncbi:FadR/GntR family transcriptional regulator [Micromonospora rubida]|uniref:FadR/GntR family transcriptional regulator n=1 Tax=Micromonospora rubida TaxID=2697657 RepID=UPI002E2D0796|nr:FCD domain-containing protein [Micromonospora rubida]